MEAKNHFCFASPYRQEHLMTRSLVNVHVHHSKRKKPKMKASEMANEELTDCIVNVIGGR